MELWEFRYYLEGLEDKYYRDDINIMKTGYYSGMFSRETKRKPKSLNSYINDIKREYGKLENKDVPVDVDKSREIHETIEALKRGE